MQTSNFRISGKDPRAVAISRGVPVWYNGKRLIELAPSRELMKVNDDEEYKQRYQSEVLDKLHPQVVVAALKEDSILLCWEKPGKPCHRRLVAAWLESYHHINIPEVGLKLKDGAAQQQFDL